MITGYVYKSKIFIVRSSHWLCTIKNGVLNNFAKYMRKNLYQSFFLLEACNFVKKDTFSYRFCEIFKKPFLQNTSGRLFLSRAYLLVEYDVRSLPLRYQWYVSGLVPVALQFSINLRLRWIVRGSIFALIFGGSE